MVKILLALQLCYIAIIRGKISAVPIQQFPDAHYCKTDKDHIMCLYKGFNSFRLKCIDFRITSRDTVRQILVPAFTNLRNRYAFGEWPGDSHPLPIPNMRGLLWDNELADLAERWALQCPSKPVQNHGDVVRFHVAQFVAIAMGRRILPYQVALAKVINDNHTFHCRGPAKPDLNMLYSATSQYNWTKPMSILTNPHIRYFGCAIAYMRQVPSSDMVDVNVEANDRGNNTSYQYKTLVVCNFGPIEEPYEKNQRIGEVCSACPEYTTCFSSSYPGLCLESHPQDITSSSEESPTDDVDPSDECPVTCINGAPHVSCEYNGTSDEFADVIPLSSQTNRKYILMWHNVLRDAIAAGKMIDIVDIPLAANMREITWNEKLEQSALIWAQQCNPYPDMCRDEHFPWDVAYPAATYVNQLVLRKPWNFDENGFPSFTDDVLSDWWLGNKYLRSTDIRFFNSDFSDISYTNTVQLIWAKSYMIGCAMTFCRDRLDSVYNETVNGTTDETPSTIEEPEDDNISVDALRDDSADDKHGSYIVAVCNYAPGGNLEGDPIYMAGGPCTECQKIDRGTAGTRGLSCSHEYTHLCSSQNVSSESLEIPNPSLEFSPEDSFGSIRDEYRAIRNRRDSELERSASRRAPILFQPMPFVATHSTASTNTTPKPVDPHCKKLHKCYNEYLVHTICRYSETSQKCKDRGLMVISFGSTRFVELHNNLRSRIANEIWDRQLETSARLWATQCLDGGDQCRDRNYLDHDCKPFVIRPRDGDVYTECSLRANQLIGELVFDPAKGDETPSADEIFDLWANEVKDFKVEYINQYRPSPAYDDFAQLIWARTFLVGCAYVNFLINPPTDNASTERIARLVCNYAPAGNLQARSVYLVGGACSQCQRIYQTGEQGLYCSYPFGLCDPGSGIRIRFCLMPFVFASLVNSVVASYE